MRELTSSLCIDDQYDDWELQALRILCRRVSSSLLVCGRPGVGRRRFVERIAAMAGTGSKILGSRRFVEVDVSNVPPEESRVCLESLLSHVSKNPKLIVCLFGMAALLNRVDGESNKSLLSAFLSVPERKVIGILTDQEYTQFIAADSQLVRLFTRIEIAEPDEIEATEIVWQDSRHLEEEYGLEVNRDCVSRAVALSASFVLNEHLPGKATRILQLACDDLDFARQIGCPSASSSLAEEHIVKAVSELTGIPEQTIAGANDDTDLVAAFGADVVGQEVAVQEVATELTLVRSGLTEAERPASVMLFAGMTGVGKTELARSVARLYSSSKRLQTYSMANFTEPHSVSGIIGVPPGYVGHEQGGRLVNELNSDPYSVFLLDEADKAHPNVWKPFLNLFDEGWLVDQRGTRAWADRAVFILTTNAGDRAIAQMSGQGKPQEEIVEHVRRTLSRIRHERSSQPVFPAPFLARLSRIIVFGPLSEAAMCEIAEIQLKRLQERWSQKRNRRVEIDPEVAASIGQLSHARNQTAGGSEGGRIVRRLISDLIEVRIQNAAMADKAAYESSEVIEVTNLPVDNEEEDAPPRFEVRFRSSGSNCGIA